MIPLRNTRRFFRKALRQPGYALYVFLRRMRSSISRSFLRGKSAYPEAITLFLTHRCNLRCRMCGQWGEGGVTKKESMQFVQEELPLEKLQSFVDSVFFFKPNFTLFGGEPLLYPGCLDLINYIKQKNMHCLLITNGSMLKSFAEAIVTSGLDELNVSLDGNARLHDQIRGMPGLFEIIMRGIGEVNFFKNKHNKTKPLINIQCTITEYNYRFLESMLEVAQEAGACSLTYHNLIFLSRDLLDRQKAYDTLLNCSSGDWEGFVYEPGIDPEVLQEKMSQILSRKYAFSVDFYPNFSAKAILGYYRPACAMYKEYKKGCLSPWIASYIFPDGEVRPCLNCTYSFGNIKSNCFREIWNSERAVRFRRVLKKEKIFPVCIRCTEFYRY